MHHLTVNFFHNFNTKNKLEYFSKKAKLSQPKILLRLKECLVLVIDV